jgi:hypothetical protein
LLFLSLQIKKEIRDNDPALFTNQRLYHAAPSPLFKDRNHILNLITDIPEDSVLSATLYFKTNFMGYYREFKLKGQFGHYQFLYDHNIYPGTHLQYYFIIKTEKGIHGTPLNQKGELEPTNKLLIDPIEYFKQESRLNK